MHTAAQTSAYIHMHACILTVSIEANTGTTEQLKGKKGSFYK